MFYVAPNSSVINTSCVEFVSSIQVVEPTEENKLDRTLYIFFVRTMSGYVVSFEEETLDEATAIRNDFLTVFYGQ